MSLVLVSVVGCNSAGIYPVTGELIYPDGSPAKELAGSRVIFEGVGANERNYSSEGEIDQEGKFKLTTARPGDGAPLGMNRVLIERKMIDAEHAAPRVILEKYERFETSGLDFEVTRGKNHAKFNVERIVR